MSVEDTLEYFNNLSEVEQKRLLDDFKIHQANKGCKEYAQLAQWHLFISKDMKPMKNPGKWMVFSSDIEYLNTICKEAVLKGIVSESKFTCLDQGTSLPGIFYVDVFDIETHKNVVKYLIEKGAVGRTKKGLYCNIAYKLDEQTRNKEYNTSFTAKLNLSNFIDLATGKFKPDEEIRKVMNDIL
jgi:hypothetical protein